MSSPPDHVADPEAAATAAVGEGDHRRALEILMHAHGQAVYRYCRAMLRDADRANDVLQKTFVQAYQGLARFEGRSSLRTWLFAIARHRCLDEVKVWRRWARRATAMDDVPAGDMPDVAEGASVERGLLDEERRRIVARCVEELAPRTRDAIVQRYTQGLSYAQMSDVTGEQAATLRARVARALPALRRCVEGSGVHL
jgi:RNA polymerase sigma factor (sigma-70 family)